ncbi:hypothetical protein PG993_011426 [Apiospora rasikravindrae]|uniref:Uncharacterized protein n=1 Tax=Apiospora rasikravindrae TaxID=990691 RepID=A0ABR1SFJ6_9PEZI
MSGMPELHLCYGVGVAFLTGIADSEPSVPPTSGDSHQYVPAQVSQGTSSRFTLDLKFNTKLLGGDQRPPCFCLNPEEAQDDENTLLGLSMPTSS